jgi:LacI family transcriptional regulator
MMQERGDEIPVRRRFCVLAMASQRDYSEHAVPVSPQKPPRVALLIETSGQYGRQILQGVSRYLLEHGPWSLFVEQRQLDMAPAAWLRGERWDGIISRPTDPALSRSFSAMGVPVVDLNDLHDSLPFPRIISDNAAIGFCGAMHLLERGFNQFAFCGFSGEAWAAERWEGFRSKIRRHGCDASLLASAWRGRHRPNWYKEQKRIIQWIKSLPKPVGIMTCNDVRGHDVLNACTLMGLAVPEEVAVIGVDNEATFCELCSPPLSSVIPNAEQIGYEAAALLESLMQGGKPKKMLRRIAPIAVKLRRSTDILAVDDRAVVSALRYIREQALRGCKVEDVARAAAISRSVLERRFRKYFKRSPQSEIRRVQIARVKQLLLETDHKLPKIATLCGFEHPEYLSVMFKRTEGVTPGQYRKNNPSAENREW